MEAVEKVEAGVTVIEGPEAGVQGVWEETPALSTVEVQLLVPDNLPLDTRSRGLKETRRRSSSSRLSSLLNQNYHQAEWSKVL